MIEDSPEDLAEMRRLLLLGSGRSYVFSAAETGANGLKACLESEEGLPDCVLLDYNLPDYIAPELLLELGGPDSPCCPVVVGATRLLRQHALGGVRTQFLKRTIDFDDGIGKTVQLTLLSITFPPTPF